MFLFELAFVHVRGQSGAVSTSNLLISWTVLIHLRLDASHQEMPFGAAPRHARLVGFLIFLLLVVSTTSRLFSEFALLEHLFELLLLGQTSIDGRGHNLLHCRIQRLSKDRDSSGLHKGSILVDCRLVKVALHYT